MYYRINGGNRLRGVIDIGGAKNAAVAIIPAALLVDGICRIENVPKIKDVTLMLGIIKDMGAEVRMIDDTTVTINSRNLRPKRANYEMVRRVRASYYLLGALLARFGEAAVAMPGGCDFGVRPIDQHIKGFQALGAQIKLDSGYVNAEAPEDGLIGAPVFLDIVSVGATINIVLAATLAKGLTIIENAAKEPHIVDLANFLNSMGADIRGAGTDVIKIRGVDSLHGGDYMIIPDQIEAGTYMAAVAAAGGEVTLRNVIPKHLECISAKLIEMGVEIEEDDDSVTVRREKRLKGVRVKTMPYPGFPTDMQPQIAAVMVTARGNGNIIESVWESNRFRYIDELKRLGGKIQANGRMASIEGVSCLRGAPVQACDLRAGAALVIAALSAEGETLIDGVYHIERGYEDIVEKLRAVGADISRVEETNEPETLPMAQIG